MELKINLIKDNDLVKVKFVGNTIEINNVNTCNKKASIKKLKGNKSLVLSTGEIVENKKAEFRGDNMYDIIKSQIRLQDLVKENTIKLYQMLYVTLTYAEDTLDIKKTAEDFKAFIKYLRRHFTKYGEIEYINTLELNEAKSGYHIHSILFFNKSTESVFLPVQTLNEAWRNGWSSVGKPKRKDKIYNYLTPHLVKDKNDKNRHMGEKAERLLCLPAGANLYRKSKGIKEPLVYTDTYENIKKYINENECKLISEQTYKNPMQSYKGNNLYYKREIYSTETTEPIKRKRTPI